MADGGSLRATHHGGFPETLRLALKVLYSGKSLDPEQIRIISHSSRLEEIKAYNVTC